ncbi:alkaline phosphatase family protein [Streptomyces sp. SUK 48]|uniref:alkaline phosphatase family protein n=1 Tax=Streptomyces sp. SUK 48 TaxID=2582831 RepID=UPI00129ABAF8|nr:alkaline phosphatase family protein [Streptomyces sp. SUK 48]
MPRTPKVLVIGLDGALLGRIREADAPHLAALTAAGLTAPSLIEPGAPTLSGPGWATILTGVRPAKHRVRDNSFAGHAFARYPDFLTRLASAGPDLKTCAITSWAPLAEKVFSARVGTRIATPDAEYDAGTTDRVTAELRDGDPDALFVQLDGVDDAGHRHGAASPRYLEAIHGADARVGRMVAAVEARPADEDWLVLVTADHGHTDAGGHGGPSLPERRTFLIAVGGGLAPGSVRADIRMPDVAATALTHLGLALDPAWDLDGRPLRAPAATR